ncbi:nuclear condensing complex subunit [Gaertneriomyces semiglobifer]|nr:nuclear condensing complex subunit [Gaertneriomyces semiglobifer]
MSAVPAVFQDAVRTTSNHRKNVVALRKIHLKSGSQLFDKEFAQCVLRLLPVKKGNSETERAVKFITTYLESFTGAGVPDATAHLQPLIDSLVSKLLALLSRGFKAKDKVVRFRVCQLVGVLLNHMQELDDDLFLIVRDSLLERTRDKEATVRAQAALAISRLQESGDEESDELIRNSLIYALQHDTSADVRKCVLWNCEVNTLTLPYVLERTRDIDANVRKMAFMKIIEDVEQMAFLTPEERGSLLQNGLSDRDANVQKCAVRMLCDKWLTECNDDILVFLRQIHIGEGLAAELAARAWILANPKLIPIANESWENLAAEEAFFFRVYIEYLAQNELVEDLEVTMPPLVRHAELLQRYCLLMAQAEDEENTLVLEFILKQLLLMAQVQDFSDEMGRREMLTCLRDMLSPNGVPEDVLNTATKLLRKVALNDSDFTQIVVEALYSVFDLDGAEPASLKDAEAENLEKSVRMLHCLTVIKSALACMEDSFQQNPSLNGILESFIRPALKSHYEALRFLGLECLALSCLLDKNLAAQHVKLFLGAFNDSRQKLSTFALQMFFDLTIRYGRNQVVDDELLVEIISETLQCDDDNLLTLAIEGAAKLMMLGYLHDQTILQQIIVLYYHPHTKTMNRLRQCLSYFLPVFAHASHRNQQLLQLVALPCLTILIQEYLANKDSMIQPLQIGQQLVEWTDVRKLVRFHSGVEDVDEGLHAELAIQLLQAALQERDPTIQKIYCQLLTKINIEASAGAIRLTQIAELITAVLEALPPNSALLASLRRFARLVASVDEKAIGPQNNPEAFLELQQLTTALSELRVGLGGATPPENEVDDDD